MATIPITEEDAKIIYDLASEVEPEDAIVLDQLYRKMRASLEYNGLGDPMSSDYVDGPLSKT